MPRQTRSSAADSPVKSTSHSTATSVKHATPITFILPKCATSEARFLLLKDPATTHERRYFFDPTSGLYEFTKVGVSSIDPRSTLFAPAETSTELPASAHGDQPSADDIASGYTCSKADILVATPVDVAFHLLPVLNETLAKSRRNTGKGLFLALDDLFETTEGLSRHLKYIVNNEAYKPTLEKSLEAICDAVDAGDEKMFRLNEDKVLQMILRKARGLAKHGLPASMEERFVSKALEKPLLSIKREDSNITAVTGVSDTVTEGAESSENAESQSTSMTSTSSSAAISEASSVTTVDAIIEDPTPAGVRDLLCLRTAISFITASYINPSISSMLDQKFSVKDSPVDFTPLNEHLQYLSNLRAEAAAARSFGDFSRKRVHMEDEDAAEVRAEKKRKMEEEEKRKKAGISRGVRDLQKVNVSGMKKMSDFFAKKPTPAKAKT